MATHHLDKQQIYTEQPRTNAELSVSVVLEHTQFTAFADDVTREAAEIRARYAALLAAGDNDEE